MKLYIEAFSLVSSHFSGVARYILGVLRALDDLVEQAEEPIEVRVLVPIDKLKALRSFGFRNLKTQIVPLPLFLLAKMLEEGTLPPLDLFFGRGAYIFTGFLAPKLRHSPSAVVVYDLSFEFHKEYADDGTARILSRGVRRSVNWVDRIITISDNAREEILGFYKLDPTKVVVATPAADPQKFYRRSCDEIAQAKARYGIEGDYIMALSNLEPRKNLGTLIDVYCELPDTMRDSLGLLLVGAFGWKFGGTMERILELVEQGHNIARPFSYVVDEDTPALLSGAAMLVYPSHYEGFGMPPLEALSCGTPVITADNSSLPQVVGSAGRLVPADQPQVLRDAIEEVFANLEQETAKVAVAGPLQAQNFCWRKSASIFLDIAKELNRQ